MTTIGWIKVLETRHNQFTYSCLCTGFPKSICHQQLLDIWWFCFLKKNKKHQFVDLWDSRTKVLNAISFLLIVDKSPPLFQNHKRGTKAAAAATWQKLILYLLFMPTIVILMKHMENGTSGFAFNVKNCVRCQV